MAVCSHCETPVTNQYRCHECGGVFGRMVMPAPSQEEIWGPGGVAEQERSKRPSTVQRRTSDEASVKRIAKLFHTRAHRQNIE